ncbi:uncharacterized protein EV420DRAFT_1637969 [Desarmillaria tabescens]|uniref:F-box domain-containing protein n=1 Tax=Armillaria tabescens TaxID=1929756 RepID=A0AA39NF70_ARMTA|nr:uncharacterized protein EV420DRAFT_1637969 [Desarmillaria tabescens]KAK0464404.1 hypothetical protein EV420DRAFT_1637969 [Desarmillaria tabescens]
MESYHRRTIHSFPPRIQDLWYNNDPPLECDKPLLLETVLTGPRRLAELEALEQSIPDLDGIDEDCDQLSENIAIAQVALEPVRRLHDIVLSEIFIACHEDMTKRVATGYCNSLNSEDPPWTLSQVCRRWRSVALSTARIWSSIKMTFHEEPMSVEEEKLFYYMLCLQLERSQSHPLSLMFCSYGDFSDYAGLQILLSAMPRCTQLGVVAPSEYFHFFSECRGSFSALEHLFLFDVTDEDREDASPDFEIDAFEWAPNLNHLHLASLGPASWIEHIKIPWSQLTSHASHLAFDLDHKACSAKTLFLQCMPPIERTPKEVDLDHVRELQLYERQDSEGRIKGQVPYMRATALETLVLRYIDVVPQFPSEIYMDMQSLEIECTLCEDPCSDIHLVEFLRTTSGIKKLKLSVEGITEHLLCSLIYQSLLPSLEHLDLTGSTFAFQSYQVAFVRTVKSRRNPMRIQMLGPACRLQHLNICSDWISSIRAHPEVGTVWEKLLDGGLEVQPK